ncbi:MAG: hypothetical protein GC191_09180 [Azospirillum sp.]|nr:hypothetical protein [Azospirillum sp.]
MARVICASPNASTLISGVSFASDRGQMISEEIPDDVAAGFLGIPGYKLVDVEAKKPEPAARRT